MWSKLADFSAYTAGDWLSVLGLALTIIGFTATLIGVLRARSAAERAQEAVADVRKDIRHIGMVADFATAIAAMEEMTRLHREGAWQILPERYAALRKSLVSIKSANENIPQHHQAALQSSIQLLRGIQRQVEEALAEDRKPSNVVRLNSIVFEQIDDL